MVSSISTVQEYIESLDDERRGAVVKLRAALLANLPAGYTEIMLNGMPSYVVPLGLYPKGYHANQGQPLPFVSFASQKNYVALYHMGLYADDDLRRWFIQEWQAHSTKKLDMGKSCIRMKDVDNIPFELIGELARKITPHEWIRIYEHRILSR